MFSVIVPVHNGEKTLRRCVESLAPQVSRILLIENGSIDRSRQLCHTLAEEYPNICGAYLDDFFVDPYILEGKTQQEQVKALLDDDCNVVIVAAVEPSSLAAAMDSMGVGDATIISYHGMVADCPAIRYSLALDGYANGRGQARCAPRFLGGTIDKPTCLY